MEYYLALRLVHILTASILFGTGLGIAFFMIMAVMGKDVASIAATARHVVLADTIFTAVAIMVQPITGLLMIMLGGYSLSSPWLLRTYLLYGIAAAAWLPVVWIQLRLADLAKEAADNNTALPDEFGRLFRIWFWLGWPGFLSVLGIFWLMVYRPSFA